MLTTISLLTVLLIAAIYPLCFWISAHDPLKQYFHRFHIGMANVLCGLCAASLLMLQADSAMTTPVIVGAFSWLGVLLGISWRSWDKESLSPYLITIPSIIGLAVIYMFGNVWLKSFSVGAFLLQVLGGCILCASLFAMNLGHWYLNVHGLPIVHLRRAVYVFAGFLATRAIIDAILMFAQKTMFDGDAISVFSYMLRVDGFLLWLAVFFGTLFPLGCIYFVKGTLDVKNTQAATGILYALLVSVLIGDLTYKYYYIKAGILL